MLAGCRIDGIAGRGGMGVVYEATDLHLERPVALKLILSDRAQDAEFRERFDREARLTAAIDHPNVIPVYAAGDQDGDPYLVMRLVRGTDLHKLLRAEGRLEPTRAARIVAQVAAGLDAAHAAGLVHRDVKPANVLLDSSDHVYLTDFGLTRLTGSETRITESGRWLGTVDFASPEQLRGAGCDARSDVYALGCVLFAALTGHPPLQRRTVPAAIHAQLNDPPPRASSRGVAPAFDAVLARALAKDPDDRFPSAGDLGRAALAAARGEAMDGAERTVAVGGAAPGGNAETRVLPALGTVATTVLPESLDAAAPPTDLKARNGRDDDRNAPLGPLRDSAPDAGAPHTARIHGRARLRRIPGRVALAGVAVIGLLVVAGIAIAGAGADQPPPAVEAVTDNEVRLAVEAFSAAYTAEDRKALGALLTRDVIRVLPGGVSRGRAPVLAEYAQQFRDNRTKAYDVTDLQVRGGDAGRAEGRYEVLRRGAPSFGGGFVFGVVKERGSVRIGLIAATPS